MRIQDFMRFNSVPKNDRAACNTAGLNEQDIIRLRTTTKQPFAPPIRDQLGISPEHLTPTDVITLPIRTGTQVRLDTQDQLSTLSQPTGY